MGNDTAAMWKANCPPLLPNLDRDIVCIRVAKKGIDDLATELR